MGAIAMRIRSKKGLSVIQRGLAVLRKYGANAHLWLPGIGKITGQDLGNYLDSAGTTSASVDNPVGLVLDAANATVGPNLISNPGPFAATTGWTADGGASIAASGGELVVTNTANGGNEQANQDVIAQVVSGAVYQVSVTARRGTAMGFQFGVEGSVSFYFSGLLTNTAPQTYTAYFTVPLGQTGCIVKLRTTGSTGTVMFSSVSIKKVSGIPASQATTANKPTLRRGAVNMFLQSATLGATAWGTNGGGSATSNSAMGLDGVMLNASTLTCSNTGGSGVYLPSSNTGLAASGMSATLFALVRRVSGASTVAMMGGDTTNFWLRFNPQTMAILSTGTAITSSTVVALQNGYYLFVWSGVTTAASSMVVYNIDVSNALTLAVANTGATPGILTASQLLAAGLATTTTAAASSSGGNWGLSCNGSTTALALASVPYNVADDHAIVIGVTPTDITSTHACYAAAVGGSRYPVIYVGAGGYPSMSWRDDTGNGPTVTQGQMGNGDSAVLSARKVGTTGYGRKNGVDGTSVSLASLGTTTANAAFIGASTGGSISWAGLVYPTVIIKGTVSASDLIAIERMVGALTGPTGVIF